MHVFPLSFFCTVLVFCVLLPSTVGSVLSPPSLVGPTFFHLTNRLPLVLFCLQLHKVGRYISNEARERHARYLETGDSKELYTVLMALSTPSQPPDEEEEDGENDGDGGDAGDDDQNEEKAGKDVKAEGQQQGPTKREDMKNEGEVKDVGVGEDVLVVHC